MIPEDNARGKIDRKNAAKQFVQRWTNAEGSEEREANSFWIELFQDVLGIAAPTQKLDFERKVKGRRIDVFYEDMGVLVENKSRGVDLDAPEQRGKDKNGNPRMVTPFEQAKWYADNITPRSIAPKWIITCNFDYLRIYDLDDENAEKTFETIELTELPDMAHRLSFLTRKENSRMEREKDLSVAAGKVVARLYDTFAKSYIDIKNDAKEKRSLNVLITRIVFLLYAEDAGLLHERNAFYNYLEGFQVAHMRRALIDLFNVLKTPEDTRDPYMSPELSAFPYVNGGLFAADIIIPQFTEETRFILLQEASADFDWSGISPTIFGALFESTINEETRKTGGMHYTSIQNIHRLTGPLFYDELKDELTAIEGMKCKSEKERIFKLNAFRSKIASLKFLDPACGSGNFLTETYLSLRKLENRVLEDIYGDQMTMGELDPIQVTLDQFYGIEINDFAVEVAKTALWIAELQMLDQTREILSMWIDPLPLKSNENIVCANALRTDWNEILPVGKCNYVIGNPPFFGGKMLNDDQREDIRTLFGKIKLVNSIDYVSGWYMKAAEYMDANRSVRSAFVSTNSITQGEQVHPVWNTLMQRFPLHINFAYRTFIWDSEALDKAHVHVVIIGFSVGEEEERKTLFEGNFARAVFHINPYLVDGPDAIVEAAASPLSASTLPCVYGSLINDGSNYIFKPTELEEFLEKEPGAERFIRPLIGSEELINSKLRYVLYLRNVTEDDLRLLPETRQRIENVRELRAKSPAAATRKTAETPERFYFDGTCSTRYLVLPSVSSGRRSYVPIDFCEPDVVATNLVSTVEGADLFCFGVLTSKMHNEWMRAVAGRMKSDYRYSPKTVYNTYPWPDPTDAQRKEIERCAQSVLDAREAHPNRSLAEMYDGISPMPENPSKSDLKKYDQHEYDDLKSTHAALDAAVEAAYGVDFAGDEEKIVAHLFKLYAAATQ